MVSKFAWSDLFFSKYLKDAVGKCENECIFGPGSAKLGAVPKYSLHSFRKLTFKL